MIAVIFEVRPAEGETQHYLDLAAALREDLILIDGFISIERFQSLSEPGKILSLSFWRDEEAVRRWRNRPGHRATQAKGRNGVFADYRLRVASVIRDYGQRGRDQAPPTAAMFMGGSAMTSRAADQGTDRSLYLVGALFGLAAVSIWAGWMPITRLSVTTSLTPYDLAMLRFGTAGLLLLPVLIRHGLGLDRLRWWQLLVMVVGAGAPYSLVAASGLRFAPAADAGVLTPGVMPLFVAVLASVALRERIALGRKVGYSLILLGVIVIAGLTALLPGQQRSVGHLLFLTAAFMWACYTIILRKAALAPLHAAAIVAVGSAVGFTPVYLATQGLHFTQAPVKEIAFQMLFQSVVATILSLYLFGKAVSILGASAGAAFGALVPAMAALLAIPIVGETPSPSDWAGILAVSLGVYLASGGPLWRPRGMVLPADATEGT